MAAYVSKTLAKALLHDGGIGCRRPSWYIFKSPSLPTASCFSTSSATISFLPQSQPQEEERSSTWSKVLLFIPGAITFGLGTWQIFRRQDKIRMLDYRQSRLAMDPLKVMLNDYPNENLEDLEFRRVLCRGFLDEKNSIYVGPRSRSISGVTENGYYLITPLMPIPDDPESVQTPVLINRGWVPRSWRDKSMEDLEADKLPVVAPSVPTGEVAGRPWWRFWSKKPANTKEQVPGIVAVEVLGVVRGSEKPSIFVPENDPNSLRWFYVDVCAIARSCGLPEKTLYIEDINEHINPCNPYPVTKDAQTLIRSSVMPQDHLNYTFTWYSLSAAVTYMAFKRLKTKKRR